MKRALAFIEQVASEIAARSARIGARVALNADVLDRSESVALQAPGLWSANRSCRLLEARDGWIAANLPRADDLGAVPALLERDVNGDPWDALVRDARDWPCAALIARAEMLGLAVVRVGETNVPPAPCAVTHSTMAARGKLHVLDFSTLWAGPLCGAVFAAMGAEVVKLESTERPDTIAHAAPALDRRLNGGKARRALALKTDSGRAALLEEIARADVMITSARARALRELGVAPRGGQIWIAITGHGYESARVAFGDDAAASGGLVRWVDNQPRFLGDAIADPLTGLAAAHAALGLLDQGRGGFVDAAMARTAAYVAALP